MTIIIAGAGQAGLLAARRLANYNPTIIERQESLPNNHSALLRFRSNIVGEATGLSFKKVKVHKGVLCEDGKSITNIPNIRDINAYSIKSTGVCISRSIINTEAAERFIAPTDFIRLLSHRASIKFGTNCGTIIRARISEEDAKVPIISTIPMPELMELLEYPVKLEFNFLPIWTINCDLYNVDVYQTLYVPYGNDQPYRVSITGNILTMECAHDPSQWSLLSFVSKYLDILFPGDKVKILNMKQRKQPYGKIVPIDDYERQKFILWATDNYNIYSLGRYATWRQILLDDIIKDIGVIQKFVDQRSNYHRMLSTVKG